MFIFLGKLIFLGLYGVFIKFICFRLVLLFWWVIISIFVDMFIFVKVVLGKYLVIFCKLKLVL